MKKIIISLLYLIFLKMISVNAYDITDLTHINQITPVTKTLHAQEFNELLLVDTNLETINLNYTNIPLWIQFELSNKIGENINFSLFFTSTIMGKLSLFEQKETDLIHIQDIDINDRIGLFPKFQITLSQGEHKKFVVKRTGQHQLETKVQIASKATLENLESRQEGLFLFYLAVCFSLIIYNFFLFIFTKEKSFLLYCGFLIFLCATISIVTGFMQRYIVTFAINQYLGSFSCATLILTHLFANNYLSLRSLSRKFNIYQNISLILCLTVIIFNLFTPLYKSFPFIFGTIIDINIISSLLILFLIACYLALFKKNKLAKIYIVAWLFMYSGIIVWFSVYFKVIPPSFYGANAIILGNICEMLVLAIGLAYKINILREENLRVKIELQDKEKYSKLLRVLSHDIANSLFIILNYAKKSTKNNFDNQKAWSRVLKSSEHIEQILHSVKQEQQLALEHRELELSKTELDFSLNEAIEIFEEKAASKNIRLIRSGIATNCYIQGEKSVLTHQIFGNILSNAIKYSPINSDININTQVIGSEIAISFEDFGKGIDKATISRAQSNQHLISQIGTNGEKGSGFGLHLVHSYIKIFNARIDYDLEKRNGTKITLYFRLIH